MMNVKKTGNMDLKLKRKRQREIDTSKIRKWPSNSKKKVKLIF
jgi:hypothetical protein